MYTMIAVPIKIEQYLDTFLKDGKYSIIIRSNVCTVYTVENILEICEVLLENMEGMMKFRSDMSSSRLFCKGVPVSSNLCSAYR